MVDAMNQVLQLRQQGMTDNQIVQQMQRDGVSTQDIFDALSQADIGGPMPPPPGASSMPPSGVQMGQMQMASAPSQMPGQTVMNDDRIQEVAEQIINEKWEEVIKEVQKVVSWKQQVEGHIQTLQDNVQALKDEFNQLRQGVLGRINESDDVVRNVSSELKAVHKVFKDVIPTFTENVAELSRLTGRVKPVRGKATVKTKSAKK
jgi:hypothetical protein